MWGIALLVLGSAVPAFAQASVLDTALHSDVLKLVQIEGERARMDAAIPGSLEHGKQILMRKCPNCSPEFTAEWVKQMQARLSPDDLMQVVVRVYEHDLTDAEVRQLIPIAEAKQAGKPPVITDDVRQNLLPKLHHVQNDIVAGCSQIAEKLGGEVAEQIAREHPGWVKSAK